MPKGSSGNGGVIALVTMALAGLALTGLGLAQLADGRGQGQPGGVVNSRGLWVPASMIDVGVVMLVLALILLIASMRQRVSIWWFVRKQRRRAARSNPRPGRPR